MSVMKELQSDIAHVVRKEIGRGLDPVKGVHAQQRKYIADLSREVTDRRRAVKQPQKAFGKNHRRERLTKKGRLTPALCFSAG